MRWWLAIVMLLVGCGGGASSTGTKLALNWFPESEHGGYFTALVDGLYATPIEILPGGPGVPVIPRVASGEVQLGIVNADDVVGARAAGVPVKALLAPIHRSPVCVMVHAASGITKLSDLKGMTLALQSGMPHVTWLEKKLKLDAVTIVPYSGSVAPFLANPKLAQQAYVFSEPIVARAKGADPRCLPIAETGFDPYASVLVTSDAYLRDHPDVVRAVTEAAARGWSRYLADPGPTNAEILKRNPEIGRDALDRGAEALRPLVLDDDAKREGVGSMRAERWATLIAQMREVGLIDRAIDPASVFDARFVPPAP
jgi:NitT/TauT family transport system substrate-binding protein